MLDFPEAVEDCFLESANQGLIWFLAWPPLIFQEWQLPAIQLQTSLFLMTCAGCEVYFSLQIVEKPLYFPQQVDAAALDVDETLNQESWTFSFAFFSSVLFFPCLSFSILTHFPFHHIPLPYTPPPLLFPTIPY